MGRKPRKRAQLYPMLVEELDQETLDTIARVDEIAAADPELSAIIRSALARAEEEERQERAAADTIASIDH